MGGRRRVFLPPYAAKRRLSELFVEHEVNYRVHHLKGIIVEVNLVELIKPGDRVCTNILSFEYKSQLDF